MEKLVRSIFITMLVIWLCGVKLCLLHRNLCLSLLFLAISPTTVYYKASIKLKPSPGADQSLFWWTLRCIVYIPESSLPDSKSAFGRPIYPFYPFPVISGHLIKNIKFIPELMKPHMVFRFRVIRFTTFLRWVNETCCLSYCQAFPGSNWVLGELLCV